MEKHGINRDFNRALRAREEERKPRPVGLTIKLGDLINPKPIKREKYRKIKVLQKKEKMEHLDSTPEEKMSPVQLVTLARGETIFLQPLKIKVNPEILKIRERLTEITAEKMAALLYLPKMNALQVCKRLKKERLDLEARMMSL